MVCKYFTNIQRCLQCELPVVCIHNDSHQTPFVDHHELMVKALSGVSKAFIKVFQTPYLYFVPSTFLLLLETVTFCQISWFSKLLLLILEYGLQGLLRLTTLSKSCQICSGFLLISNFSYPHSLFYLRHC